MRHCLNGIHTSLSIPYSLCVAALSLALTFGENVVAQQRPTSKPASSTPAKALPMRTGATPAAMSNTDVIELVNAGFSDDLIAVRLKQAANKKFDLSTKGMVELKAAGVSERLIAIMFGGPDPGMSSVPRPTTNPPVNPPTTAAASTATEGGATQRRDAGIYLRTDETYTPLEPTVFSGGKTGGVLTSGLTMGIKKAKWKAVVRTPRAGQRIQSSTPEFYFYFENRTSGLNGSIGSLFGASSPNEFVLARMSQNDDERQLIVGEFGVFGASSGTRSRDTVALKITRLEPGIYKVSPSDPLPAGEYCFFYAAGASTFVASGTGKLFDFGVDLDTPGSR